MTCDHALLVSREVGAPNGRGPRFLEPAEPAIATPLDLGRNFMHVQLLSVDNSSFISLAALLRCCGSKQLNLKAMFLNAEIY